MLRGQFQVPQTYGLTTTPLPAKFRQSGVFGGRVWCGRDVQFSAHFRIRALTRFISVMQSIVACWSVCLSRIASSYRMLRAAVTPIACTWSTNTLLGASFNASSSVVTLCPVSMPDAFPNYGQVGLKTGIPWRDRARHSAQAKLLGFDFIRESSRI